MAVGRNPSFARSWPWLLAPAGVALAWLAGVEQLRNGRPWTFLVSDLIPGLLIIAAGLLIWRLRPQNRCWWMLVAAGFAWFIGDFEHSSNEAIAVFAFAFGRWYGPFLGWALLAYPGGRVRSRFGRALVVALFALFAMRSLSRLFLHVPPDVAGFGTTNRFLPITDDRWWRLVEEVFAWGYVGVMLLVLANVAFQWLRSSRPGRRMISPALFAASVLTAAVAFEVATGWNAGIPPATDVRAAYVVSWAYAAVALALAAGIFRLRWTRSAVIDMIADLGPDAPPARLGDALSRALGDQSLTLLPWSAAASSYVDANGIPVDLPRDLPNRAVTQIERGGQPVAAIEHDVALLEDPGLVNAVVAAVRLTIDNERLQDEIETQLAEVEASRSRIVAASDAERRRIERNLHDGAQQRLVTIALALKLAEARLDTAESPDIRAALGQAVKDLAEAIDELRDLARGIHPPILSESGLRPALESLAERSTVPVQLDVRLSEEPPGAVAAAAYFAVSEALTNIAKHANAGQATVSVAGVDGIVRLEVSDDGVGGAEGNVGTGLVGIADRVAAVGGTMHVHSPPGEGTRLTMELPCASS
jgi:signal transduction histidine kinase